MLPPFRKKFWVLWILSIFCLPAPGFAAAYEIDTVHSSVTFKVRHLVGAVRGGFASFSGTVEYDEENPAASSVRAEINTASIDTNNDSRDKHLASADFFDAAQYPKITFVSKNVDPAAGVIKGDLTMHGVTREISIPYKFGGLVDDKRGGKRIGGSGETQINREEFGIAYDPSGVTIGHEVDVMLDIEAVSRK